MFTPPPSSLTRPDLRGTFGMSATTHWVATATAQSVLEQDGNAFDAAVAAAFVLHLVEPHLNGPGGDMTGLIATAADPAPRVLVGQGPAPAGASIEHVRAEGLDLVPGAGGLAAAVPGAVDAWLLLLRDHGTWELADVWRYVLGYAEHGYPLVERVGATAASVRELFTQHWTTSADFWLPGGRPRPAAELMTNPAYAAVLRGMLAAGAGSGTREARIDAARLEWSTGVVAHAAATFLAQPHRHSTGTDHAGVLTADGLRRPRSELGAGDHGRLPRLDGGQDRTLGVGAGAAPGAGHPRRLRRRRARPADGPVAPTTCSKPSSWPWRTGTPTTATPTLAAGEQAVPLEHLLSPAYATERRRLIGPDASAEVRPGEVPGRTPFRVPLLTEPPVRGAEGVGEPTVARTGVTRGDTCHVDVVDRWGNLVSATPSGGWLQSSPHIPELGFCLGTRLQMTWLDPSAPSALRPGRRPRTTLSPTLLLRDGVPVSALGTPGGDQQDQWQLVYLLRTLVGGHTPQQAIDAPSLHTTSMAGSFWPRLWTPAGAVVEDRMGDEVLDGLTARGHVVTRAGDWTLGRLSAVTRDPVTGELGAAANSRGNQGYAAGR